MSTIEAPPSPQAEFKTEPRPNSTCTFTGNIRNNANVDLVFIAGSAQGGWSQQPPARIAAGGGFGSFGNTDAINASGYVQYQGVVNGTEVNLYFHWSVPWIGSNSFSWSASPGGKLYAAQSGDTGGWSPDVTWTVTNS